MKKRLLTLLMAVLMMTTLWYGPVIAEPLDETNPETREMYIPGDWNLMAEDHFDVTEDTKANIYTGGTGFEGSWSADYACTENSDEAFLAQGKKIHTVPEILPVSENDPNYVLTRQVSSGEMTQFRKMSQKIDLTADAEYYLMFDFYSNYDTHPTTIRLGLRDSTNESTDISVGTQVFPPAGKMIPTILSSGWQVGNADQNPIYQQPTKVVPVNDMYTAVVQISARATGNDLIRFRMFYDTENEEAPSFFPNYWTTQYEFNGSQNNLDTLEFFSNCGSGGTYNVTLDNILLYKGGMVHAAVDNGNITSLTAGQTVNITASPNNIQKHPQTIESVTWYDNTTPGVLYDPISTGETFTVPADMTGRSLLAEVVLKDTTTGETTTYYPLNQYVRHDLEIISLTFGSQDGKGSVDTSKLDTVSQLAIRADITRNNNTLDTGWVKMALVQYDELGQQKQIFEPADALNGKNGNQVVKNIPYNGAKRIIVRFIPVQDGIQNFAPGDTFKVIVGYIPEKNADGSTNTSETPITDANIVQDIPFAETASDSQLRQNSIKVPGGTQSVLPETWRSALYPEDWTPGYKDEEGRFLHDFSYAGYHRGEKPIPEINVEGLDSTGDTPLTRVYNVVSEFQADPTGTQDATKAIQAAIDAAGEAGGGIVYLPEGTYAITQAGTVSNTPYCLLMQKDNVVLKGDGPDKTHLFINQTNVRNLHTLYMGSGSWYYAIDGTERKITQDLLDPTMTIPVENTDGYEVGDWIIVGTTRKVSDEFATEYGLGPGSNGGRNWSVTDTGGVDSPVFYREILNIDRENNIITIDSPTRHSVKIRDGARIYKIAPHVEELGVQDLSFGNLENLTPGLGETQYNSPGTGAYEMHDSYFIMTQNIVNSWIKNVTSYRPVVNTQDYHMASNAIWVHESKGVTIENCRFEKALYQGGAGNGYAFAIGGNDCLYKNCSAGANRHNYSFRQMSTSGNVLLNCISEPSKYVDDFHQHLSMANLIDGHVMNDVRFEAVFRSYGTVLHGQVTTESVFWNCTGGQVVTRQFGNGYAIGCSNVSAEIGSSDVSKPMDYVEGTGNSSGLVPSSLYLDQLTRRLQDNQGYLPFIQFANENNKNITDGFSDTDMKVKVKAVANYDPTQNETSPSLIAILFKKADPTEEGAPDEVIQVQQDTSAENYVFETDYFDFSMVDDISQYYIKIFLWDSIDNMSPLLSKPIYYDSSGIRNDH